MVSGSGGEVGDRLVSHPDVARVAFTGSVEVGRRIQSIASRDRIKVVTLELGGKNPIIVFDDAPLDDAVAGVVRGMNFAWQGQSCGSTSRLYVERGRYEAFLERVSQSLASMRIGNPLDESTDVGAVVSRQQFELVCGFIDRALQDPRVRLICGGTPGDVPIEGGFFIPPTVLAVEDDRDCEAATQEIFGPVLVAMPFDSETAVLERANALPLGLTASVWTTDLSRAMRFSRDLETGHVWINWSSNHVPGASFGGVKDSGVGSRGEYRGVIQLHTGQECVHPFLKERDE